VTQLPNSRQVVRDSRFQDSLRLILEVYPRAEAVITGLEWSLARQPKTDGIHVGDDVWQAHLMKCREMPAALVYYTFNPRMLFMLRIKLVTDN
jgi:hypothetical protein